MWRNAVGPAGAGMRRRGADGSACPLRWGMWAAMALAISAAVAVPSGAGEPPAIGQPGGQAAASVPDEPLVHEGVIAAPIERVWAALSTPEGYKAWGVAQCEMDFRVGGLIRSHYNPKGVLGDEGTIEQQILAFETGRMLAVRIHKVPAGFPFPEAVWRETWSVLTLTDLGDGRTHLRIAGCGYDDRPESRSMRKFFETGNAASIQMLQARFDPDANKPDLSKAHDEGPLAPITLTETINAPRLVVWRALTTAEGWRAFLGVEGTIDLRPGGPMELYFAPDAPEGERGSDGCVVLSFVPEQMVSFTWNAPPSLPHARAERTWVVVRLDALSPSATRVRLDHLGFAELAAQHADRADLLDELPKTRAYFARAWPGVLGKLKAHFEILDQSGEPR